MLDFREILRSVEGSLPELSWRPERLRDDLRAEGWVGEAEGRWRVVCCSFPLSGDRTGWDGTAFGPWPRPDGPPTMVRLTPDLARRACEFAEADVPVDFRVTEHGTVTTVEPLTDRAREWVDQKVETEGWQWMGNQFACHPRLARDLVEVMGWEGFRVRLRGGG